MTISLCNKITIANKIYKGTSFSFSSIYNNCLNSLPDFKSISQNSYTVDVHLENVSGAPVSSFSFSDNMQSEYFEISIGGLKTADRNFANINTFINRGQIGFYIESEPEFHYIADGKNFRKKWNNSMYSKLFKIPDFIPDNINYNKVSNLMSPQNLPKLFLGMGVGKTKLNIKNIVENIKISHPTDLMIFSDGEFKKAKKVSISIPDNIILSYVKSLNKSSENAQFGYLHEFLTSFETLLNKLKNNIINVEFVISDNKLICGETALVTSCGIYNLCLDIDCAQISINLTRLSSFPYSNINYCLELSFLENSGMNLKYRKSKQSIMEFDVRTISNKSAVLELTFLDNESKLNSARAIYKAEAKSLHDNVRLRNIYSLSVLDIFGLYNKININ